MPTRPVVGDRGSWLPAAAPAQGFALAVLLLAGLGLAGAVSAGQAIPAGSPVASPEADQIARWVTDSGDNGSKPFLIIDKVNARVFVFDAEGRLRGADAALLGMARGDGSVEGIGDREVLAIRPEDRTTPAGRFLASLDLDVHGQQVLLIDYETSIALHPVIAGQPAERRAERLTSPTPQDNRISYGCINVPANFYEEVVRPAFADSPGLVYILPETSSASEMFGLNEVPLDPREQGQGQP